MTDNAIIKALMCCTNADCLNCPRWSEEWSSGTCNDFLQSVLDLINRQKAEIERLKTETSTNLKQWKMISERTKEHYSELYEEAKGIVRAEAIKEFAERLKKDFYDLEFNANTERKTVRVSELRDQMDWVLHTVSIEIINDLVKEMTEDPV